MLIRIFIVVFCLNLSCSFAIAGQGNVSSKSDVVKNTETMEEAALKAGFKHSDVSYTRIYTRIAGVGIVLLVAAGIFVFIRKKMMQQTSFPNVQHNGKKITTLETTQVAYGVKAILLDVDGQSVLVVQTKESHTVTPLDKAE